jgi:hypothetical protein
MHGDYTAAGPEGARHFRAGFSARRRIITGLAAPPVVTSVVASW